MRVSARDSADFASPPALIALCAVRCATDMTLMCSGKSADANQGCYVSPASFEFDCVSDGGAPIPYDKTLLAGADHNGTKIFCYFSAAELETWQL